MAADKNVWILTQVDKETGRSKIYVARDAVKAVNLDHGFEVIASAPSWNVSFIRRAEKTQRLIPLKEFRYFSVFGALDTDWNQYKKLPVLGHEERNGFKLSKYYTKEGIELYLVDNIEVAPEVGTFLQCYFHTPLPGVPYKSVYHFARQTHTKDGNWLHDPGSDFSGQKNWLSTLSVSQAPYSPGDFQCPSGYKIVNDQTMMVLSHDKMNAFNNVLQVLSDDDKAKAKLMRDRRWQKQAPASGLHPSAGIKDGTPK